jgi:hypothetical protein
VFVLFAVGSLIALALFAFLVVNIVEAAVAWSRHRERVALEARSRWEAHHYSIDAATRVVVRRVAYRRGEPVVFETVKVTEIEDDRADWYDQLQTALAEARERAALLSLQRPDTGG